MHLHCQPANSIADNADMGNLREAGALYLAETFRQLPHRPFLPQARDGARCVLGLAFDL
jgi:hypothetical protein